MTTRVIIRVRSWIARQTDESESSGVRTASNQQESKSFKNTPHSSTLEHGEINKDGGQTTTGQTETPFMKCRATPSPLII